MKLVDADALQNSLRQAILNNTELYPNYVRHGMQTAIEQIDNASDASQPLRERVAELESLLNGLLLWDSGHCHSSVYSELIAKAKALLKGDPNA